MPTALVIDDSRHMADGLCQLLDLLGIDGRAAYGSREGIMEFKHAPPDVVFLDISMPGVSGFEVMSYFRRIPEFARTPVIVITSDDQPETAQRAKDLGAVTLILKPVTVDAVEAALRKAGLL